MEETYDVKEERKARGALRRHLAWMHTRLVGIPSRYKVTLDYAVESEKGIPIYGYTVDFNQEDMYPLDFEVSVYQHSYRVKPI